MVASIHNHASTISIPNPNNITKKHKAERKINIKIQMRIKRRFLELEASLRLID